ncbi:hypothetical protein N9108_07350, partial [Akkermansiaceae bacterium]|nr:hypothetical protein [Akkermansiaceae bacterium]
MKLKTIFPFAAVILLPFSIVSCGDNEEATAIVIPLAILALLIGSKNKHPHISHLLWLLVLIKLITPPLF